MTAEVTAADALFGFGSLNRANAGASAALDALIGIDYILAIAFSDRFLGAFGSARAAADARIGNFVSHNITPPHIVCSRDTFMIPSYTEKCKHRSRRKANFPSAADGSARQIA